MSAWPLLGVVAVALLTLYAAFVIALLVAGRKVDARALAGFLPDCAVLFRRLLTDRRVPISSKLLLALLLVYLLTPIDLVPDFIPAVGYVDDAIIVGFVLRRLLRRTEASVVAAHWPGPSVSLNMLLRLPAGTRTT